MKRAYYSAPITSFLNEDSVSIFGSLANQHRFDLDEFQKYAWTIQIELLKKSLVEIQGHIFFEFSIPRMGKRVDVIVISQGLVFVIEFKVGEKDYPGYAIEQVMDYALDLKNFHETSHPCHIVPMLVSTNAKPKPQSLCYYKDNILEPLCVNRSTLGSQLKDCIEKINAPSLDPLVWESGQYKPTPTIIEAAKALYRKHNVLEISRSDAGTKNLSETTQAIDTIIENAKQHHLKAICFITGVPGAGKTLAGLNIANHRLQIGPDEHAVFLSGNGPLVIVLREALVRDDIDKGIQRKAAARKAEAFIQNIHHFRDEYLDNQNAPPERVVVFDEAQRAWTQKMTASFMKRKRGRIEFSLSEPEFLIDVMNRHSDWAVIICLIGGGQEINTGEAGLAEWFKALDRSFHNWQVYVSDQINDSEFLLGGNPKELLPSNKVVIEDRLHLAVSTRSFRSEKVAALIKALLDNDILTASNLYQDIAPKYPIYLTRDLKLAKDWILDHARGSERYGILASSGAARLRPEGIFVNANIEVEHWFLDKRTDVRSSYAMEGTATEFDIQGLELDWTIVAWDADLRHVDHQWEYKSFKGSKWQTIGDVTRQRYLTNTYRVLLTRARQGMVIFIPEGDELDETRLPTYYDGIYEYLKKIGFTILRK